MGAARASARAVLLCARSLPSVSALDTLSSTHFDGNLAATLRLDGAFAVGFGAFGIPPVCYNKVVRNNTARAHVAQKEDSMEIAHQPSILPLTLQKGHICGEWEDVVRLYQTGFDEFTVQYGLEVHERLPYAQAARLLGSAIMHSVACDSRLSNVTKAEARKDHDTWTSVSKTLVGGPHS